MADRGFVGELFTDAIAPGGEIKPFGVEVENGYPLESGQKATPGRLDEVTIAQIGDGPGMGDRATSYLSEFTGPGVESLKNIFGSKG